MSRYRSYTIRFRHVRQDVPDYSEIRLTMPDDVLVKSIARALRASDELVDVGVHVEETVEVAF